MRRLVDAYSLSRSPAIILAALAAAVFAAGLAWRLSIAWSVDASEGYKAASREDYFELAHSLSEVGVLGWAGGGLTAFRGVAYPALLSTVEDFRPERRPRSPVLQAVLGAVQAPLAAATALEFSVEAGLAAGALAALHPGIGRTITGCQIETLFGCLVCLIAWALVRWCRDPGWGRTLLLAFFIGVSLLCRAVFFALPVALVLAAFAGALPSPGRAKLGAVLVVPYMLLAPWAARNAVQFGRFIPFEDQAATRNFYAASLGIVDNVLGSPFQDVLALEQGFPAPPAAITERRMLSLAVKNIVEAPGSYLMSCLRRLVRLLGLHPMLLLMALAGALRRRADAGTRAIGVLCVYYVLVHIPMTLEPRYFEPVLPVLAVLAGGLIPESARRSWQPIGRTLRRRLTPAALLVLLVPLYLLCVERLGAEILLTRFPCRLPRTPLADYYCGEEFLRRGEREKALPLWRGALAGLGGDAARPSYLTARLEIAAALAERRGSEDVCGHGVFRRQPKEAEAAAIWRQDHGRLSEALRLDDLLLACYPEDPDYLVDRSIARVLAGEREPARQDLLRALEISPGDARASQGLGSLLELDGRNREALEVYERALASARGESADPERFPEGILMIISSDARRLRADRNTLPRP
ncbi:MAG: hypothetical protein ACHQ49_01860 [Elusimicrobiota bacterium]